MEKTCENNALNLELIASWAELPKRFMAQLAGSSNLEQSAPGALDYAGKIFSQALGLNGTGDTDGVGGAALTSSLGRDLGAEDNAQTLRREFARQDRGEFAPYQLFFTDAKGKRRAFNVYPRPLGRGSVAGLIPGASGASALFSELTEGLPGFAALADAENKVIFANAGFRTLFGEAEGKSLDEIFKSSKGLSDAVKHWQKGELAARNWMLQRNRKLYSCYSSPLALEDGSQGLALFGMVIPRNLLEHKEEGADKRYRHLEANLTFGLVMVREDMTVHKLNRRAQNLFGEGAKIGAKVCDVLDMNCSIPDGCERCPINQCFASGGTFEREFSRVLPTGQEQFLRMVACPVKTPQTGPRQVLVLIEDISKKRFLEQKLMRAQRLEAMGTLAAGIAHEINQPLSALNLYAGGLQMLVDKKEAPSPDILRERLNMVLGQVKKIKEIIGHMRVIGAQEESAYEKLNIGDAIIKAVESLGPELEKHRIKVELRIEEALPDVKTVAVQLHQALYNLSLNAIQAMAGQEADPAHGRVLRLGAKLLSLEKILVEVADSGPGIPLGLERRIFDPFFTTKDPNEGMGLGLPIVHAFITSWGGDVAVKHKHPELDGAAIYLGLPTAN